MLITCQCLNIIVEAKETEKTNTESGALQLASVEELERFFKEDVKEVQIVSIKKQINSLVQCTNVGSWSVEQCLNCSTNCFARHTNGTAALVNSALIATNDAINHMKNHRDFSQAFRIIIQPVSDNIKGINAEDKRTGLNSARQSSARIQCDLTSLQNVLREAIRDEITKTEERILAFSEQQYKELEDFRTRAMRDEKALASKICELQVPFESRDIALSNNVETDSRRVEPIDTSFSRRLITSKKAGPVSAILGPEKEFKGRPILGRPVSSYSRVQDKMARSLDSEGLFVIEGMEDTVTNETGHSEGESDTDHEDSGSHDEGIDVHRKLTPSFQLAQSLPVNVPVYSATPSNFDNDDEPSDAVDIAASIKALARSVHGDTVFGDLPRPRFSSQI